MLAPGEPATIVLWGHSTPRKLDLKRGWSVFPWRGSGWLPVCRAMRPIQFSSLLPTLLAGIEEEQLLIWCSTSAPPCWRRWNLLLPAAASCTHRPVLRVICSSRRRSGAGRADRIAAAGHAIDSACSGTCSITRRTSSSPPRHWRPVWPRMPLLGGNNPARPSTASAKWDSLCGRPSVRQRSAPLPAYHPATGASWKMAAGFSRHAACCWPTAVPGARRSRPAALDFRLTI